MNEPTTQHEKFIMFSDVTPYTAGGRARKEGCSERTFDWEKAKHIVEKRNLQNADCGLREDWFGTGGTLVEDGVMISEEDCNAYLTSIWATPIIQWEDGEVLCQVECWKWSEESK